MQRESTGFLYALWLIAAVGLLLIVRPWELYFLADDFIYISKAPELNYLYRTAFRPVSDLTLLSDYWLWGKNAAGYHFTNFLLHLLASVLAGVLGYRLSQATKNSAAKAVGALVAIIFLVYPFVSESVFWIVGRGGSLSTIFMLLALIFLLGKKQSHLNIAAIWALQVLALLTYETSWLLPAISTTMLLLLPSQNPATQNQKRITVIGLWALLMASFILRKITIGHWVGSPYLNTDKFEMSPATWLYNYATGFFRSFIHPSESSQVFMLSAVFVALVILLALWCYRHVLLGKNIWSWLIISFLLALLPVALLGVSTHTSESERFLYWPAVFLCLLLALVLAGIAKPVLRYSILFFYVLGGLWGFHQSSKVYHLASQWNRTSVEALQQHPGIYTSIVAENLPQHYKGGFMFRLGFEDAVKWLAPKTQADTIVVLSTQELVEPKPLRYLHPTNTMGRQAPLRIIWTDNTLQLIAPSTD